MMMQYLKDLECPIDFNTASSESSGIMDWLLHYAVDLTYSDRGKQPEGCPLVSRVSQGMVFCKFCCCQTA